MIVKCVIINQIRLEIDKFKKSNIKKLHITEKDTASFNN